MAVGELSTPLPAPARRGRWGAVLGAGAEIWAYRDLLLNLVKRYLAVRYKRSVLGFGWSWLADGHGVLYPDAARALVLSEDPQQLGGRIQLGSVHLGVVEHHTHGPPALDSRGGDFRDRLGR